MPPETVAQPIELASSDTLNSRAVVQLGNTDALVRSILIRDFGGPLAGAIDEADVSNADGTA